MKLSDDQKAILAEQERDARECERAWGRELTDDELDEICESYGCLEDVIDAVFGDDDYPADDTREPY